MAGTSPLAAYSTAKVAYTWVSLGRRPDMIPWCHAIGSAAKCTCPAGRIHGPTQLSLVPALLTRHRTQKTREVEELG